MLLMQAARGAVPSSPLDLILDASMVTKVVLAILAVLSLLSWSIMFGVWRSLAKAAKNAERFSREFERMPRLDEAGALGKPVWILLPHGSHDWRWLLDREDSVWYPTARLFRQPSPGDWDSVARRVHDELGRTFDV